MAANVAQATCLPILFLNVGCLQERDINAVLPSSSSEQQSLKTSSRKTVWHFTNSEETEETKKQKNCTPEMSEKYSGERKWLIWEGGSGKEDEDKDEDKDEEKGQGALGSFFNPVFAHCSRNKGDFSWNSPSLSILLLHRSFGVSSYGAM